MSKKFLKTLNFPDLGEYQIPRVDTVNGIAPDPETGDVKISGGGYVVKANMTYDEEGNPTVTTEGFNWEELQSAVEAGKAVFCRVYDANAKESEDNFTITEDYPLVYFSQEEQYVEFVITQGGASQSISIYSNGKIYYHFNAYTNNLQSVLLNFFKPLIVTRDTKNTNKATHSYAQIKYAWEQGQQVFFKNGGSYIALNGIDLDSALATFYQKTDDNASTWFSINSDKTIREADVS